MARAKAQRETRRQLGQWMTPPELAESIVKKLSVSESTLVLEPSFGQGSFLLPMIHRLMEHKKGSRIRRFHAVMQENIHAVEIDPDLFALTIRNLENEFGPLPKEHNLRCGDFFRTEFPLIKFDIILGNPPYGGTFDPTIEDLLDRKFGSWKGLKVKKETYSFFIAQSLDLLTENGALIFITSDTFLTIKTMDGLRRRLMDTCTTSIETLQYFSDQTQQPTLVLTAVANGPGGAVTVNGELVPYEVIEQTGNLSWRINETTSRYFSGPTLGDYVVCTSGMTIGKNELFLRQINDSTIVEEYDFEFIEEPITFKRELERARLNQLSIAKVAEITRREQRGETRRNVRIVPKPDGPLAVKLPHKDYVPYNKATKEIVFAEPSSMIFWRNDGDAVLTFKKNGNWYLHGVGGQKFFFREGLTWQLIASRINMRYLPSGYVLDSGAPCAFLREGKTYDDLLFILGWSLTELASEILKTTINHTRNIQSKDIERLPYPWWVEEKNRRSAVDLIGVLLERAKNGELLNRKLPEFSELENLFRMK